MVLHRTIVAASLAASLVFAGAAFAHPRLIATTPTANSATASPSKVQLKFSEKLIGPMTAADVTVLGMRPMPGMPAHGAVKMAGFTKSLGPDGKTVTLVRARPLAAGTYRVDWHAVSVDTHRVAGSFKFTVK
jgi:methionine-rich copper-binding protein CopC